MTLGTPNTLLNFKYKNITIKNSASEKLLGVNIDNKLDFREHLNTVPYRGKISSGKNLVTSEKLDTFPRLISLSISISLSLAFRNFC